MDSLDIDLYSDTYLTFLLPRETKSCNKISKYNKHTKFYTLDKTQ